MSLLTNTKDLVFRVRHGFRGYPIQIMGTDYRVCESLRRWTYDSEHQVHEIIHSHLANGDFFVDVGANFGMHTLPAANLVGTEGRVIAFEPIASNRALLQRNLVLNSLDDRVRIYPGAVSDWDGVTVVMTDSNSDVAVDAAIAIRGAGTTVLNYRLDQIVECRSGCLKLIKIDVEGAELSVLRSADKLLSTGCFAVVVEMHPGMMEAFGDSEGDLYAYMNSKGFKGSELSYRTAETYQVLFKK